MFGYRSFPMKAMEGEPRAQSLIEALRSRSPLGRRHPLSAMLALVAVATLYELFDALVLPRPWREDARETGIQLSRYSPWAAISLAFTCR